MNYYAILVTDSDGTYMLPDDQDNIILFLKRENAEMKACSIASDYFLAQVVPYNPDNNYVINDL